jgi:hypothetical protein
MSGKGGRPKGGSAKHDTYDKELPMNQSVKNTTDEPKDEEDIRSAIHQALVGNMGNLTGWLTAIGKEDPVKAMTLFQSLAEYVLPKQQRTDSKQNGMNPIIINFEPSSKASVKVEDKREYHAPQPTQSSTPKKFNLNDIIPKHTNQ